MTELDGILPVDKPDGPTSHDVVGMARRALRTRRIGHTGTLDPFASGLLLLCVGPSTRLSEYLTALPKSYRATVRLGETTDTDDRTGEVVRRSDAWQALDEPAIQAALARQVGTIGQLPPRYSAKKIGGERMYAVARRGGEVERDPVRVTIHRIELLGVRLPEVDIEVECSSGTYIRAIARDLGEALETGGHLTRLRRTRVGAYGVERALPVDALPDVAAVERALLPPAAALAHLPRVVLDPEGARLVSHGRAVPAPAELDGGGPVVLLAEDGALLAIAERRGDQLQPRKVFS
jgi:tRNA pseudouridine55 synthase